jgi:hypothetical protein
MKPGKVAFTARAHVLPVPDAIVQSDWHGQVAPTCRAVANNVYNKDSTTNKKE